MGDPRSPWRPRVRATARGLRVAALTVAVALAVGHQPVWQAAARVENPAPRDYTPSRAASSPAVEWTASLSRSGVRSRTQAAPVERLANQRTQALLRLSARAERYADELEANRWVMPLSGYVITSGFGPRWGRLHAGLDLAAPTGTPLVAVARGTVTEAGYSSGYGNRVVLRLDDGTRVWYCHMSTIAVSRGDRVVAGDLVGTVGSTGNSTGPHLHLEIRPRGRQAVDPFPYLRAQGLRP